MIGLTLMVQGLGNLQPLLNRLRPALEWAVDELAATAANVMTDLAPERTGRLRASIRIDRRPLMAIIGPTTYYAKYVELGTRPHIIRPRRARFLHFWIGEREIFAKVVHHPGTRPQLFVKRAADAASEKAPHILAQMLRRWLG